MSDTFPVEQKRWYWMYVLAVCSMSKSNYIGLSLSCC